MQVQRAEGEDVDATVKAGCSKIPDVAAEYRLRSELSRKMLRHHSQPPSNREFMKLSFSQRINLLSWWMTRSRNAGK